MQRERGLLLGVLQFLGEALLLSLFALFIAFFLAAAFLPEFNQIVQRNLKWSWDNWLLILIMLGLVLFTGILSGSYPAFYLSKFDPAKISLACYFTQVSG